MLEFFGGVPEILVPDNLKSAVTKACRYDPELNPSYQQLAEHYQVGVIPARPRKPKDKPKAEVAVQIVERWILARLRHQIFFSLAELNHCIRALVKELNERPFKKLPGNRQEAFEKLDKPALRPLPAQPWRYRHVKKARVNIDYHVEYEQHHYSVPHQHVGSQAELHAFDNLLEVYVAGQLVATHPRRLHPGNSTTAAHMPERHRHHHEWTPGRLKSWAAGVGGDTLQWVSDRLAEKAHPEQAYRLCLGLLNLTREVADGVFAVPANCPQDDVSLKMPAFEWVHVLLRQQMGAISLSPSTICNSACAIDNELSPVDIYLKIIQQKNYLGMPSIKTDSLSGDQRIE